MKTSIRVFLILSLLVIPFTSAAAEAGKTAFRSGLKQMEEGKYKEAAKDFSIAAKKLPSIRDYSLLYLSRAYLKTGSTDLSLKAVKKLLKKYPKSPAMKEAKKIEIEISLLDDWDRSLELLDVYTKEFPSDIETRHLYGGLLKRRGLEEKARYVFREIYIEGGEFAQEAHKEIRPLYLSQSELFSMALNLIEHGKYTDAEDALIDALEKDKGELRDNILEQMALVLFRQKKYDLSADIYLRVGDLFMAAKSFFRAGDRKSFRKTLNRMIKARDEASAELMIAEADDLRRKGKTGKALDLFYETIETFPSASENALWWIGWTHYKKGDYKKASGIFDNLYASYPSGKYLYWKARAVERTGKDAFRIFKSIYPYDFYGFLAGLKTGAVRSSSSTKGETPSIKKRRYLNRIDTLIDVGLVNEAAEELALMASRTRNQNKIIDIAFRLTEVEKYSDAINIVKRLPYARQPKEILYPLAFWKNVDSITSVYSIDPFLVLSLIREESRFDQEALSSAGAMGLMQLMPDTARRLSRRIKIMLEDTESIYDIDTNIRIGAYYLSNLISEFKSVSAALAAYNAGESRVRKWLKNGNYESKDEFIEDIPYRETRRYVKRIIETYSIYKSAGHPHFKAKFKKL
jgi:soluble lytic murein transglycosylase